MKIKPNTTDKVILVGMALWIIYDVIVVITKSWDATLSYRVWLACHKFMLIPLAFGTVVSHFTCPRLKFLDKIPKFRFVIWIGVGVAFLVWSLATMPIAPIHPFIVLFIGIGNGLWWAIKRIED